MPWFKELFGHSLTRRAQPPQTTPQDDALQETHYAMTAALTFGLEARNRASGFMEHCTRVATTVNRLADLVALSEAERHDAFAAAQLHEIGMIAVPAVLLETRRKLTEDELELIRQQATIGAHIVRATHSRFTALMIQHQYTDFAELRRLLARDSTELLLAGLLRVADVFDTLSHPRPYQGELPPSYPEQVIRAGAGTKFHPELAALLLDT